MEISWSPHRLQSNKCVEHWFSDMHYFMIHFLYVLELKGKLLPIEQEVDHRLPWKYPAMARRTVSMPRVNEIGIRTEIGTGTGTGRKTVGIEIETETPIEGGREVGVQAQKGDHIVGTETIEIETGIGIVIGTETGTGTGTSRTERGKRE